MNIRRLVHSLFAFALTGTGCILPATASHAAAPVSGTSVLRLVSPSLDSANSLDLSFDAQMNGLDIYYGKGLKYYFLYQNVRSTINMTWQATDANGNPLQNRTVYLIVNKYGSCSETKFTTTNPMQYGNPQDGAQIALYNQGVISRDWCGDDAGGHPQWGSGESSLSGTTNSYGLVTFNLTNTNNTYEAEPAPASLTTKNPYASRTNTNPYPCADSISGVGCLATTITASLVQHPQIADDRAEDKDLLNIHYVNNAVTNDVTTATMPLTTVSKSLGFTVTNLAGLPQAGVKLNFTNKTGIGTLSADSATTDSDGYATVSVSPDCADPACAGQSKIKATIDGTLSSAQSTVVWSNSLTTPQNVVVTSGAGQLGISWDPVSSRLPGATVTYTATTDTGQFCTTTTTACDILGLVNDQTYSVTVIAADGTYISSPSSATYGVPVGPPTPPGAPGLQLVSALKGQVALSVTSPSDIGGSSVTGYDYSVDNGSTWSHFASVDGPFRISGLINGTTYQVRIRAVNVAGAGVASDAVSVTPTNLVPSIPTINSTVAGNQSADVVIATATGVTAASITGYQYNINGGLSWSTCAMTDNRCVVSGLINGVRTTIKVRAVNPNGVGLASAKAYVTPVTTAQAPTITSLIPSVGALTIAFSAPSDNGGSKVLRYEYSLDGETWIAPTKAIVKSPYKIVGLANASAYTVQIRAINAVGVGEASSAEIVSTPVALASAPVVTSLVAAKNSITVNFSTPVSDGGGIITNFAYMIDGKNWVSVNPASASSPIVIGGLLSNKSYTVKLRAINSAGSGAISAAQSVKTLK